MKRIIFAMLLMLSASMNTFAAIGDLAADLVFTPITPCRIVDTRGAGGVIPAASSRVFKGWNVNYTAQGGSNSNCGLPQTTNIAALAVNLLVIVPAAEGWIAAWPVGTSMPLVSNLNYKASDVLANSAILKINQTGTADFNVYTVAATHLAVDVTGYYSKPVATALTCTTLTSPSVSLAANSTGFVDGAACAAGTTLTGILCRSSNWGTYAVNSDMSNPADPFCAMQNTSASSTLITVQTRCCQIPGR